MFASAAIVRMSACISLGRTTPMTSVSSTQRRSLACVSVRAKEVYSDPPPVSSEDVENTGEVIIAGMTTYSGDSKMSSTSSPRRNTKERSSRSESLR